MRRPPLLAAAALLTASIAASGCAEDPIVIPEIGFLTVTWTIDGAADPALCQDYGVAFFYLEIYDEEGFWVADRSVPCDNFTLGMRLYEDGYVAEASLIDPDGLMLSDAEVIRTFAVEGGEEETLRVDFPPRG